ncbi:MAG: DUF11 domain-containing protein [Planctomycetes bacterium]|nr:DUF11 domain-containing protein [Planctomycetota bacterium]
MALAFAVLAGCKTEGKETPPDERRIDLHITKDQPAAEPVVVAEPAPRAQPAPRAVETTVRPSDGLYWTERAYPTGDKATSVVVLESGTPGEVSVGVPYDYILRVRNISTMNLENVVVVDKPRGNFALRSSVPQTQDGKELRWEIGSLRPNEAKEIKISGTAIGEGQVVHCAEVDWRSLFCSTTQVVKPGLAITKTATAATLVCDPITYTVTVANTGTGTTRNIVIDDRLPDGVETLDGKTSVRFTLPSLEPGQSKNFTWKAKAKRTGKFAGVATAKADGDLTAQSGEVETTVTRPVLVFERQGTKQTYKGKPITYDMIVKNTGDGEARDVVVSAEIPTGAKYLEASPGSVMEGSVVRWKFGTMQPGTMRTFAVKISYAEAAIVHASATASAYCAESVTVETDTQVTGVPAILLEVVDLTDPVEVGGSTTYVITATNQGSAPGTNIRIVVMLEDTMNCA